MPVINRADASTAPPATHRARSLCPARCAENCGIGVGAIGTVFIVAPSGARGGEGVVGSTGLDVIGTVRIVGGACCMAHGGGGDAPIATVGPDG